VAVDTLAVPESSEDLFARREITRRICGGPAGVRRGSPDPAVRLFGAGLQTPPSGLFGAGPQTPPSGLFGAGLQTPPSDCSARVSRPRRPTVRRGSPDPAVCRPTVRRGSPDPAVCRPTVRRGSPDPAHPVPWARPDRRSPAVSGQETLPQLGHAESVAGQPVCPDRRTEPYPMILIQEVRSPQVKFYRILGR